MSARPRVTNPARPADHYHMPGERIIEFYDDVAQAGGLIAFQRIDGNDGRATLRVNVYNCDADKVEILAKVRPEFNPEDVARIVQCIEFYARKGASPDYQYLKLAERVRRAFRA